jgi:Zn-dependent protease
VALAGPAMNLLLALGAALALGLFDVSLDSHVGQFLFLFLGINSLLAVFNLLPLPPLDGSRLLTVFLPPSRQSIIFWLDRYGFFILLLLLLFGGAFLLRPVEELVRALLDVAGVV